MEFLMFQYCSRYYVGTIFLLLVARNICTLNLNMFLALPKPLF